MVDEGCAVVDNSCCNPRSGLHGEVDHIGASEDSFQTVADLGMRIRALSTISI